jgi:hypothetical protein
MERRNIARSHVEIAYASSVNSISGGPAQLRSVKGGLVSDASASGLTIAEAKVFFARDFTAVNSNIMFSLKGDF